MSAKGQVPFDPVKASLEATFAAAQTPTSEPVLAQTDEVIRETIRQLSCEYEIVELPNGKYMRQLKDIKFPDVYSWVMATSYLDSTSFFDRQQATTMFLRNKHELRKQRARYRRTNPEVVDLLNKIQLVKFRQIHGDAEMGKRAEFVAKLMGADKVISLMRGGEGNKAWWKFW